MGRPPTLALELGPRPGHMKTEKEVPPNMTLIRTLQTAAVLTTAVAMNAWSADVLVTKHFSGHWDQPEQESQGIILQIVETIDPETEEVSKTGVGYWFTYGEDMQSAWYLAVGPVEGDHIDMTLYSAFGVGFMQTDLPGDVNVDEVGTLVLTFRNCNHGTAVFDTPEEALGSGEFPIKRLSSIYGSRCSGGISDDTPHDAKPTKLEVRLLPPEGRDDIMGDGKAKFWERVDRSDFHVEVEDMPDGMYGLDVCGEAVGEFEVIGGIGGIEFRSPESEGKELLTFDPRDCQIDVVDGIGVALTSGDAVLAEKVKGPKDNPDALKIEVELDNTGVMPDAEGEAEFETDGDEAEFEIEIEDVPAGFYPVFVGGVEVGQIEVVEQDGKFKGKLKFSDPQKADTELLDFDPRGEIVEVTDGTDVILEVAFPES